MPDVIVVGGGVIGLSIAWELAGQGLAVRILEQGVFGRESSWAGAGMLPPGSLVNARTPEARLRGAAHQLWPKWSDSLTSSTGMNNGFIRCGGLEVRLSSAEGDDVETEFQREIERLRLEGVVVETESLAQVRERFPMLGPDVTHAFSLPDFCQVRNPRHLQALQIGCTVRGVEMVSGAVVRKIVTRGDRIESVQASDTEHRGAEFVFAGGAWSGELLRQLGATLPIEPLKGQIVLLQAIPLAFRPVIQAGREYLVPRSDGRILVGSTEERSGFDKRNTAEGVSGLLRFAQRVVPCLKDAHFEKCWAGLRPYSGSGKPSIGRLPQLSNALVAAGHFRYGLHLSPITAVLIRQILLQQTVQLPENCCVG